MYSEKKDESKNPFLDYFLNASYYLFVILIIATTVLLSLFADFALPINILLMALIVDSCILVFYIAYRLFRKNLEVDKNSQLGIFAIIVGFLFIIVSISKKLLPLPFFGQIVYVYWGLGLLGLGAFFELTLLDEVIWNGINHTLKRIWVGMEHVFNFLIENIRPIVLYTLDLCALGGIIFLLLRWENVWFVYLAFSACWFYLIAHHSKRIWRFINWFFNEFVFQTIIMSLVDFFKKLFSFISTHYIVIIKESLRLIVFAGGIVIVVLAIKELIPLPLLYLGITISIVAEILSRKVVLDFIGDLFSGIYNVLVSIIEFIKKHYVILLKETIRLLVATSGVYLLFYAKTIIDGGFKSFVVFSGISLILIGEYFSREKVFLGWWTAIKTIFSELYYFISRNFKKVFLELLRLIGASLGILLIIYGSIWRKSGQISPTLATVQIVIGSLLIPISLIFSRKSVFQYIKRNRVSLIRFTGFCLIIVSLIFGIINSWATQWIVLIILGGVMFLFAKWIGYPKMFWEFLVRRFYFCVRLVGLALIISSIVVRNNIGSNLYSLLSLIFGIVFLLFARLIFDLNRIKQIIQKIPDIFRAIWNGIKTIARFIYNNILLILLFSVMSFSTVYGIALTFGSDFLNLFANATSAVKTSMGLMFIVLGIISIILLINQIKKMIARKIEERSKKSQNIGDFIKRRFFD